MEEQGIVVQSTRIDLRATKHRAHLECCQNIPGKKVKKMALTRVAVMSKGWQGVRADAAGGERRGDTEPQRVWKENRGEGVRARGSS